MDYGICLHIAGCLKMIKCKKCDKAWDNLYGSKEFKSCCPYCGEPYVEANSEDYVTDIAVYRTDNPEVFKVVTRISKKDMKLKVSEVEDMMVKALNEYDYGCTKVKILSLLPVKYVQPEP